MGNPTSYRGYTMTWRGKQLAGFTNGTKTVSFEYNEDGLRQQKTYNGVVTNYYYNGSVLIGMQRGTAKELYSYDASGNVVSVNHNGTEYYYLRNAQGDIVKLIDASGATVVKYTYDTWGKKVSTTGSLAGSLGLVQPFRYRGYVYDWETGLYYLQSRYYDPEVGRFISADVLLSTGQGVLGHNCYAYCLGNPVGMVDETGTCSFVLCFKIKDCGHSDCIFSEKYELSKDNPFRRIKQQVSNRDSSGVFLAGVGINGGMLVYSEYNAMIGIDSKGNIALLESLGFGGGTPTASICMQSGYSTAKSVYDLEGPACFIGASGGDGLTFGGEYSYCFNNNESLKNTSHTFIAQIGAGASIPAPVEMHGGVSNTWIRGSINVFDFFGRIFDLFR